MILTVEPLLMKACKAGRFGRTIEYEDGAIYDALFTFLDGKPNIPLLREKLSGSKQRQLVCLSGEWEKALHDAFPAAKTYRRYIMAADRFILGNQRAVSAEYRLAPFGSEEYERHPFGHCANYRSAADFARTGAGAAVWLGESIVAAASSFLSIDSAIELDIYTEEPHRRKGLAEICVRETLRQCIKKGYTVHWDAQNIMSKRLAEKFGFVCRDEYTPYIIEL